MRLPVLGLVAVLLSSTGPGFAQIQPFLIADPNSSPGHQLGPFPSGHLVFWEENRSGHYDIQGRNLATGELYVVGTFGPDELNPRFAGGSLAWQDGRARKYDIYVRDLGTADERLVVGVPAVPSRLEADGCFLVWRDWRDSPQGVPPEYSNTDIYAYDLQAGREIAICTAPWAQTDPDISGNIVVWSDKRRSIPGLVRTEDIYGYNLTTGQEFLIASREDLGPLYSPAISGNIVVWGDPDNWGDIWARDLDSNTPFPICTYANAQTMPDIDGRYVVWEDWRHADTRPDIYGYDLLTGREFPIDIAPGYQVQPRISGNLVVWSSAVGSETVRVWGAYIPEPGALLYLASGVALTLGLRRRGPRFRPGRRRRRHRTAL